MGSSKATVIDCNCLLGLSEVYIYSCELGRISGRVCIQ